MRGLRIGGHPLHPALVHFPVACWTAAPLTDVLYIVLRNPAWWQVSWWLLTIGCLIALAALTAGAIDLFAIPAQHPAQSVAQRHMLLMGSAWCLFLFDLLLRRLPNATPSNPVIWLGLTLSIAGWIVLVIGAFAGARLVYE
ncbi:MAG: DUF2231 domain-containing protein, partial [Gammaproteobacteria bacterium]